MCRSDVNCFRTWSTTFTGLDGDPVIVDWHRNELHPRIVKRYHGAKIAGISIDTVSPGFNNALAKMSSACWTPVTITIWSGLQLTPREAPR